MWEIHLSSILQKIKIFLVIGSNNFEMLSFDFPAWTSTEINGLRSIYSGAYYVHGGLPLKILSYFYYSLI